mgnify:CR=1 FL=1
MLGIESASPNAFQGEMLRLTARVIANQPMNAKVRLLNRGVAVQEKPMTLKAGEEAKVWFDTEMNNPGPSVWGAEIVPEKDHFPVNNQATTTISVRGRPRLLIIHQDEKKMRPFSRALKEQEFDVDLRGKRGMPATMEDLGAFDAVMLADISATDMTARQMSLLRSYVTDFGGGLVMTGGDNSFGLGGYYKSPVEEVLPLVSRFEKEKEKPSLAMALGGLGLRLTDLAALYTALGRGGAVVPLKVRRDLAPQLAPTLPTPAPPLLTPVAAWYVSDVLRNAPAPANAKPGEIAYKTGTSYGFRDAWAAGYDGRHTIVVWVGRPDGNATPGLAGRTTAAPILFDAFARISRTRVPLPPAPAGAILVASQELPPPLKRFREADETGARDWSLAETYTEPAVHIAFPPDRSELEREEGEENVTVKAEGGALPLTWLVDGVPVTTDATSREATLPAPSAGFYRLSVIDAKGRADRVTIRVR